jgi:hypothetical protein
VLPRAGQSPNEPRLDTAPDGDANRKGGIDPWSANGQCLVCSLPPGEGGDVGRATANYCGRMLGVVVLLVILAVVVYAGYWLMDRRPKGGGGDAGNSAKRLPPRGPVGPDDDEDFLRELDRQKRHRKKKQ